MTRRRRHHAVTVGAVLLGLLVVVAVVVRFAVRVLLMVVVRRRWRIAYRKAHGREGARSARITARMRRVVLAADRYECVIGEDCAGPVQVDHIRPWAAGGITCLVNLMGLCRYHNMVKSGYWRDRDGYVHYRPWAGYDDVVLAAAILAAERSARWRPGRLLRAAWALAA